MAKLDRSLLKNWRKSWLKSCAVFGAALTLSLPLSFALSGCDDKDSSQSDQTISKPTDDHSVAVPAPSAGTEDRNVSFLQLLGGAPVPPMRTSAGDYLAGQHAQMIYDWNKASELFEGLLVNNPDDQELQKRVMGLALGGGNFDRAVNMARIVANKAPKEAPKEALAQIILSLNDFKNGHYEQARKNMAALPKDGLGTIQPLVIAWCDAAMGKLNLEGLKDSPTFLYQSVMIADYMNDKTAIHNLAIRYDFTKIPTPISALENIADIFVRYGEYKRAREIYEALKQVMPARMMELGVKIESLAEAEKSADKNQVKNQAKNQVKSQPLAQSMMKVTPQIGLAEALRDTGGLLANEFVETAILFTQLSRLLDPKNPDALQLLAQFSTRAERYRDAINYLSMINPDNLDLDEMARNRRQIAALLEMDGQKDEAVRVLEDLVASQKNVDAQIQIGDLYRADKHFDDALKAYNKAEDLLGGKVSEKNWELLFARGMTYEQLSKMDAAEKDLLGALAFEPDQPYVLNYLGYSWLTRGVNLDKAADMIEKAARLKPDDGAIADSLGWVYFKTGKYDQAVKQLEQAVELQPYEAEINDHLGDAYWKVGRKKEARYQWLRAANLEKDADKAKNILEKQENGLQE